MLIIAGTFDIDVAQVDEFMAAASEMMKATHSEEGCYAYAFSRDELAPGRVNLYEKWESQEHLEAHFVVAHMLAFQAAIADITLTRDVLKYQISSEGPVR